MGFFEKHFTLNICTPPVFETGGKRENYDDLEAETKKYEKEETKKNAK